MRPERSEKEAGTLSGGPGPFVTYRTWRSPGGRQLVSTSRRRRKGLPPHAVAGPDEATRPRRTAVGAFRHLLAPHRLGWWVALLFAVGSAHFLVGALAATWPEAAPAVLRSSRNLGIAFFAGSVFFTTAAWLQWLEVLNAGPGDPRARAVRGWHWIGWRPRDLGFWACVVQLAGTVLFNFDTADAMLASLSWREEDLLVWSPNLLGSVCFLVASYLAFVEVSHAAASWAPRSVSWWIAVVNLAGSVAFQLSALTSFAGPGPGPAELSFASTFLTAAGALCFLGGAYLLVPELFDAS